MYWNKPCVSEFEPCIAEADNAVVFFPRVRCVFLLFVFVYRTFKSAFVFGWVNFLSLPRNGSCIVSMLPYSSCSVVVVVCTGR
jgi:hypothetical protein